MTTGLPLFLLTVRILDQTASFTIDTGASVSVLPLSLATHSLLQPSSLTLYTANGSVLTCYGELRTTIAIPSLGRSFTWTFVVADVKQPLLGIDFLSNFSLTVDCHRRTLFDLNTTREVSPVHIVSEGPTISMVTPNSHHPSISQLFQEFPQLLRPSMPPSDYRCPITHHIETGDALPVFAKARPLVKDKYDAVRKEFNCLISDGILRPSKSQWSSPLHVVPKKDSASYRPVGDYRALNSVTKPDRYPLPNMNTLSYHLYNSQIFSKLDLQRAYHQIPMHSDDVAKTAVTTPFGLYEYLSMPFGLRNAASTFQRFMDSLFKDIPFVFVYLDDILIFSSNEQEHLTHLKTVFSILTSHYLRINLHKCEFLKESIVFLGYTLSFDGISIPKSRKQPILEHPVPLDFQGLRRFLGMVGFYRKLIPNFADLIFPLTELIRRFPKSNSLPWRDTEFQAFDTIKQAVADAITLPFPNPTCSSFHLVTDCSQFAIGAALHQVVDDITRPIAFYSAKLSAPQQRYSAFDRELLAAYMATLHFKPFLEGRQVTLFTDHKPLVSAFFSRLPAKTDRQQRHLSCLTEYLSSAEYIRGEDNVVADNLSRPIDNITSATLVDLHTIAIAQQTDSEIHSTFSGNLTLLPLNDTVSIWCDMTHPYPRPYVPQPLRKQIFETFHSLAHTGMHSTVKFIKARYFWPHLDKTIRSWARECLQCQKSKIIRHTKSPIEPFSIPGSRFEVVHIDIVGPLPPASPPSASSTSYRYLLTCIDRVTRWMEAIPMTDVTATSCAYAFISGWISRFGVPLYVVTDRGAQFESELFQELSKRIGFYKLRTTAYHPQANGLVERFHRTLKSALCARAEDWINSLPIVLLGLRCHPHASGVSPFTAVTGKTPLTPQDLLHHSNNHAVSSSQFISDFVRRMEEFDCIPAVSTFLPPVAAVSPQLHTCTHVWLRVDRLRKPLEAPFTGPFLVIKRNPKHFVIESPSGRHSTVSIDRLKPVFRPPAPSTTTPSIVEDVPVSPPPSDQSDDDLVAPSDSSTVFPKFSDTVAQPAATRSGRRITFNLNPDYYYY